jgi:hypothetical protein
MITNRKKDVIYDVDFSYHIYSVHQHGGEEESRKTGRISIIDDALIHVFKQI